MASGGSSEVVMRRSRTAPSFTDLRRSISGSFSDMTQRMATMTTGCLPNRNMYRVVVLGGPGTGKFAVYANLDRQNGPYDFATILKAAGGRDVNHQEMTDGQGKTVTVFTEYISCSNAGYSQDLNAAISLAHGYVICIDMTRPDSLTEATDLADMILQQHQGAVQSKVLAWVGTKSDHPSQQIGPGDAFDVYCRYNEQDKFGNHGNCYYFHTSAKTNPDVITTDLNDWLLNEMKNCYAAEKGLDKVRTIKRRSESFRKGWRNLRRTVSSTFRRLRSSNSADEPFDFNPSLPSMPPTPAFEYVPRPPVFNISSSSDGSGGIDDSALEDSVFQPDNSALAGATASPMGGAGADDSGVQSPRERLLTEL